MKKILDISSLLLLLEISVSLAGNHWTYEHYRDWGGTCNTLGKAHRQSPIDIKSTVPFKSQPFRFRNYGLINTTFINNGHTYKVLLHPRKVQEVEEEGRGTELRPEVSGGGLPGTYVLDSFHFHWGSDSRKGSEHLLRGCAFAAEMHFVHYKKEYGSVKEALNHSHGLAVLGVWLTPFHSRNQHLQIDIREVVAKADYTFMTDSVPITGASKYTEEEHEMALNHWFNNITPFDNAEDQGRRTLVYLRQMLPLELERFYRYEGSLTTPPCTENVLWTVFAKPVTVPEEFMSGLQELYDSHDHSQMISNNYRPPLSLSGRSVFYSGNSTDQHKTCTEERNIHKACQLFPDMKLEMFSITDVLENLVDETANCPAERLPSPLNLYLSEAEPHVSPALTWTRIGNCKGVDTVNDGHILKVLYPTASPEWELGGGGLTNGYYLAGIQLRWRSEHHLGGMGFPLEIQLVHFNAKYKNIQQALENNDELVVVSKFFQIPTSASTSMDQFQESPEGYNKYLAGIFNAVESTAQKPFGRVKMRSPDISMLMEDTSTFYEYKGSFESLTNAPCSTLATWMVIRRAGGISHAQMRSLGKMRAANGFPIESNNRPIAPTDYRRVILKVNSLELKHEMDLLTKRGKMSALRSAADDLSALSVKLTLFPLFVIHLAL